MKGTILVAALALLSVGMATAQTFGPARCDFRVTFPGKPSLKAAYTPAGGVYLQALMKLRKGASTYILGAACAPLIGQQPETLASKDSMLRHATRYATANRLRHVEYRYVDSKLGREVELTGSKTYRGVPATFEGRFYLGRNSLLSVIVLSPAGDHASKGATAFLKSVHKKKIGVGDH